LFFLPWIHAELYTRFSFWPYFALLFAVVATAAVISVIKLSNGKYIFEHFVYMSAACILFLISGTLFVTIKPDCE